MKPDQVNSGGLKIRISGLSPGSHDYTFSVSPRGITLNENFDAPVDVRARIEKSARQIVLRSEISTSGTFPCDRCLAPFTQAIACSYATVYVQDGEDAGTTPTEEVRVIGPEVTVIDLSEDVREMISLSVPLKLLCREECRGLCSSCGADLNRGDCGCRKDTADRPIRGLEKLLNN